MARLRFSDRPDTSTLGASVLGLVFQFLVYPPFALIFEAAVPGAVDSFWERVLWSLASPLCLLLLATNRRLRRYSQLMVLLSFTAMLIHVLFLVARNHLQPLYVMGFLVVVSCSLAFLMQVAHLVAYAAITVVATGVVAVVTPDPGTPPIVFFSLACAEAALAALVNAQKLGSYIRIERQAQRLLESRRLAAVGILAAGVAHEINNPLTALRGRIQLLDAKVKDGTATMDDVGAAVGKLDKSVVRIASIVDNLLQFSGRVEPSSELATARVRDALDAAERFVALRLQDAAIGFKPTCPDALALRGELALVTPILTTLLGNAIDAVKDLPPEARWIAVDARARGGVVVIDVVDGGPGLSREVAARAFLPFFTTKDPGQGMGLGLSLAARAAEQLGGSLRLVSDAPTTTFRLVLPRR